LLSSTVVSLGVRGGDEAFNRFYIPSIFSTVQIYAPPFEYITNYSKMLRNPLTEIFSDDVKVSSMSYIFLGAAMKGGGNGVGGRRKRGRGGEEFDRPLGCCLWCVWWASSGRQQI
jgi:hypothetical protein